MQHADTLPPTSPRPGFRMYCDSHDSSPRFVEATVDTLLRCGAVGGIVMVEGITGDRGSQLVPLDRVKRIVDLFGAHDLDVTASAFPDVRDDHAESLDHMSACVDLGCRPELDAEPRDDVHYTRGKVAIWRRRFPGLVITTTRHEAERVGPLDVELLRLQLEQLTSVDTLERAVEMGEVIVPRARIQPVIGTFDQNRIIRTPAMVRRDIVRCMPQARIGGGFGAWCARSTSHEEADVFLECVLAEKWATARAA